MTEILLDYERPGKPRLTYREQLLADLPDVKILFMNFGGKSDLMVGGKTVLQPGSPMVWFVFPEKWYDIARFYLVDKTFTGFYTNLCTPVVMDKAHWSTTDLFLDFWISADGANRSWLDEDEFDNAITAGLMTAELVDAAKRARKDIDSLDSRKLWPPWAVADWKDRVFLDSIA